MKKLTSKKGFTLIEMLVVIAIIAVLVAIIVPTVSSSTTKAKAATDAANLRSALATATIKAMDDETTSEYSATDLGVPATSKLNGGDFKCTVNRATDGSGAVDSIVVTYNNKSLNYYAAVAESGDTSSSVS